MCLQEHCSLPAIGETRVGWDKFWFGHCSSVPNEWPEGDTNDVFGRHVITAYTGATCNSDARFASEISPKTNCSTTKVDSCFRIYIWAGKLVTRRVTVMARTRMKQYVWRNLM